MLLFDTKACKRVPILVFKSHTVDTMNDNFKNEQYIDINTVAKLKGLTSTRSLRLEINKPNSKYIAREIKVNGGTSYEILYASLEPEIQRIFASAESAAGSEHDKAKKPPERRNCNSNFVSGVQGFGGRIIQDEKLDDDEIFSRALVPYEEKPRNTFVAENARLTAYARIDIIYALENIRKKYPTKKEADNTFLEMYNSGMYLPKVFKFIGTISIGTLHRWVKAYEDYGTEALVPKRRYSKEAFFV